MSDHSWSVVRLDIVSPADSLAISERLRDLLLSRGVVVPNDQVDRLHKPSAWRPGPAVREALMDAAGVDEFLTLHHNGADIVTARNEYHPGEALEPPRCIRCQGDAPASYLDDWLDWSSAWKRGYEPTFTCHRCGWSGLVGDWDGENGILVGAPAVTFFNWATLSPVFLAGVRNCLGGRTAVVFSHW
jgi:hypothetical protein